MHINTFTYQFYGVQLPVFFPVNLKIILRNVTSRKNNDVELQNSNLKFGIMSISYIKSNFREKQHINGWDPAEQMYKIWRKNFQELLSNHIFGVGSFFKPHPVHIQRCFHDIISYVYCVIDGRQAYTCRG